jgi:hypothetical protein
LAPSFERSHWKRKRWKNLNRILCIFYFRLFSCVIWGFTVWSFNIIIFPSQKKICFLKRNIAQISHIYISRKIKMTCNLRHRVVLKSIDPLPCTLTKFIFFATTRGICFLHRGKQREVNDLGGPRSHLAILRGHQTCHVDVNLTYFHHTVLRYDTTKLMRKAHYINGYK